MSESQFIREKIDVIPVPSSNLEEDTWQTRDESELFHILKMDLVLICFWMSWPWSVTTFRFAFAAAEGVSDDLLNHMPDIHRVGDRPGRREAWANQRRPKAIRKL